MELANVVVWVLRACCSHGDLFVPFRLLYVHIHVNLTSEKERGNIELCQFHPIDGGEGEEDSHTFNSPSGSEDDVVVDTEFLLETFGNPACFPLVDSMIGVEFLQINPSRT